MTFFGILSLFNAIMLFGLFLVSIKKGDSPRKRNLAFMLLSIALWSFGHFLWQNSTNEKEAEMWVAIMMVPVMFVPLFYSKLLLNMLEKQKLNKFGLYFSYAFAIIFSIGTLLGYLSDGVETRFATLKYSPNAGPLFGPFMVGFFIGMFYYIFLLSLNYWKMSPLLRLRFKYIAIATSAAYLGAVTNYFPWYDVKILPVGNFVLVPFFSVVVYSLVSKHIKDARLILRKWTVQLTTAAVVIVSIVILKFLAVYFVPGFSFWIDVFILMHGVFVYNRLKGLFFSLSNEYFFTSLYNPAEVVAHLSDKLNSSLDINLIYKNIFDTFSSTFHMESFAIVLYEKEAKRYVLTYKKGFNNLRRKYFPVIQILHSRFIKKNIPIVIEEVKATPGLENDREFNNLLNYGVDVLMPLNVGEKTFGLLILGRKITKDIYNDDDLKILKTMGEQIALAIDNAIQYSQMKDFNLRLSEEVTRQTKELRAANEELKKLDKAKSEFITLASHQLRTPLTAIRGFLDLMMTGMYGKYNVKIGDVLRKTASATDRLNNLVEDLLMLSKIEAGNLQLSKATTDLHEMMAELGRRFVPIAKGRKIDYVMEIPTSLPKLDLDKDKMRMVIANIIDNAILYSEKGSVVVKVVGEEKLVRIMVTDSGGGISADEMPHLFEKFMRGEKQKRIYVDGVGIGLYIGKVIVQAHGGKIWAKSKEGKGSTFVVELPAVS